MATGDGGSRVMATVDGGLSWELSLEPAAVGVVGDLMPIEALAAGEAWVAG
eukprot:COSAG01_NODE_55269_length_326_cov_0.907489_1_plen_50_part_10